MEQMTDIDTGETCLCCETRGYVIINTLIDGDDSRRIKLNFPPGTEKGSHMFICRALEATKAAHMASYGNARVGMSAMRAPSIKK